MDGSFRTMPWRSERETYAIPARRILDMPVLFAISGVRSLFMMDTCLSSRMKRSSGHPFSALWAMGDPKSDGSIEPGVGAPRERFVQSEHQRTAILSAPSLGHDVHRKVGVAQQ